MSLNQHIPWQRCGITPLPTTGGPFSCWGVGVKEVPKFSTPCLCLKPWRLLSSIVSPRTGMFSQDLHLPTDVAKMRL